MAASGYVAAASESQEGVPFGRVLLESELPKSNSKTALNLIREPVINVSARSDIEETVRDIVENVEPPTRNHEEQYELSHLLPARGTEHPGSTSTTSREKDVERQVHHERRSLEKALDDTVFVTKSGSQHEDNAVRLGYSLAKDVENADGEVIEKIQEQRRLLNEKLRVVIMEDRNVIHAPPPRLGPTLSQMAESNTVNVDRVKWWLYLAEIFGRWGDRMWMFAGPMLLYSLNKDDMLLQAIHGFVTGIFVLLFGSLIGDWVDRMPRVRAVRIALVTQNSCVALGSLVLTFAHTVAQTPDRTISKAALSWIVLGFLLFAVVADCASVAMNVIVENDWIVTISGDDKKVLADLNAAVRRIDLSCHILSPIVIGQVLTFAPSYVTTLVVIFWNLFSMVVEYLLLMKVYRSVPRLAIKATPDRRLPRSASLVRKTFKSCYAIRDGWRIYFRNRVWPAGIGLAFLYMTVLAFSGVTNTFVRIQGLSESLLSISMAAGGVIGIAGTLVFPRLREKVGLERTGLFACGAQLGSLVLCLASVWLAGSPFRNPDFAASSVEANATVAPHQPENLESSTWSRDMTRNTDGSQLVTRPAGELTSLVVFLTGMAAARFGLWMLDLTIRQIIQENVREKERGVFGGVQSSLNRFMDMLKFILVMFLRLPDTFGYLIITSFLFVFGGHCFYGFHCFRTRGHILPFHLWRPVLGTVNENGDPPIPGEPKIVADESSEP